jgi:hypothetical protein
MISVCGFVCRHNANHLGHLSNVEAHAGIQTRPRALGFQKTAAGMRPAADVDFYDLFPPAASYADRHLQPVGFGSL